MFFVKVAFWALLILILLPSNTQEKIDFYNTAQRSVSEVSDFCVNNAELCEKTTEFFSDVYQKLLTATEMIEETLQDTGIGGDVSSLQSEAPFGDSYPQDYEQPRPQRQGKGDSLSRSHTSSMSGMSQNTLTRRDLMPSWHGPEYYASHDRYYR